MNVKVDIENSVIVNDIQDSQLLKNLIEAPGIEIIRIPQLSKDDLEFKDLVDMLLSMKNFNIRILTWMNIGTLFAENFI